MDRLLSMQAFAAVAQDSSFTAAAERLALSSAAVTRLVSGLERQLGVRLLHRTTRRVSLTEAGDTYLKRVQQILQDVDEAQAAALSATHEVAGTVRVLTTAVLSSHVLAPVLAGFSKAYPEVRLELTIAPAGVEPVSDFDVTLMGAGPHFDAAVVARPILVSEAVLCAAPVYLARRGAPEQPADLARHACLRLKLAGSRPSVWDLSGGDPADPERSTSVAVEPLLVANHTDTLLRATLDGMGISAHPTEIIAPHLRDGRLQRVLSPWVTGRYTLYAVLPSRQFVPRRVLAFIDHLTVAVRGHLGLPVPPFVR